eukprot:1158469-Pelagomonas_calceolata.AAC.1
MPSCSVTSQGAIAGEIIVRSDMCRRHTGACAHASTHTHTFLLASPPMMQQGRRCGSIYP